MREANYRQPSQVSTAEGNLAKGGHLQESSALNQGKCSERSAVEESLVKQSEVNQAQARDPKEKFR